MRVVLGLILALAVAQPAEAQSLRSAGSQVAGATGGIRDTYQVSEVFDLIVRNPGPVELSSHELDTLVIEYVDSRYWYRDEPRQGAGLVQIEANDGWFFNRFRPAVIPGSNRKLKITVPQRFLRYLTVEQSPRVSLKNFRDTFGLSQMKVELFMTDIYGTVTADDVSLPGGLIVQAPVVHTRLNVNQFSGALKLRMGSAEIDLSDSDRIDADWHSENIDARVEDSSGVFSVVSHTGDVSFDHVKGSALIDIEDDGEIHAEFLEGDFRILSPQASVSVLAHSGGLLHIQGVSDDRLSLGRVSQGVIDFDPSSRSCPAKLRRARTAIVTP